MRERDLRRRAASNVVYEIQGFQVALTKSDTAGEVPMIGRKTDELTKRRDKISPLRLMEVPGEARFSRPFDFASSRHELSSPPQMKIGPGYFHVRLHEPLAHHHP
jgi:hypothetical protein